jgi:hypothetical protein
MEKMTLLEMTQNILSAMNSDEVNSIADTVESAQVAEEIRTTFDELYTNHDLGVFEGLVNLDSLADTTHPNTLLLPSNVQLLRWVKYRDFRNTSGTLIYKDLCYLSPESFLKNIVEQPSPSSFVNVTLTTTSSVVYPIANNRVPNYFTIFDENQTLVFDSFDATHESYLTGANCVAWAVQYKSWTHTDTFVPPIPASEFPRFLAEAKSACFINYKEIANSNEQTRARRQKVLTQRRPTSVVGDRKGYADNVDYSRKR